MNKKHWEQEDGRHPEGNSRGAPLHIGHVCSLFKRDIACPAACLLSVSRISRAISIDRDRDREQESRREEETAMDGMNDQRIERSHRSSCYSLLERRTCNPSGGE